MVSQNHDLFYMLIAQGGPLEGLRWTVQHPITIGRDPSCDIVVPDRQVSRRHARLIPDEQGLRLEDLQSKNGTHLNGQRVAAPAYLKDGDVVQIAFAQRLLVASSDATLPLETASLAPSRNKALHLDPATYQVWINGEELFPPLSAAQFRLLKVLFEQEGAIVPREAIIRTVWGEDAIGISNQALDALVRRLRDRLAAADPTHAYIVTVRGIGLKLDNPPLPPGFSQTSAEDAP